MKILSTRKTNLGKLTNAIHQKGFALIATISILSLLTLLSVAMLNLSSNVQKTNNQEQAQLKAQANARLALQIAISQLQETMGPDQRVSATAAIFDANPDTLEIEGVAHPHIVGTWSTLKNDGTPIIDRESDGYLIDKRNPGGDNYEHKEQVLQWLVSGAENSSTPFDPRTSVLDDTNSIAFIDTPQATVRAPLVATSGTTPGKYAYHISDLGTMTPLLQTNEKLSQTPDLSNPDNGGYANLFTGKKLPYDILTETSTALAELAENDTIIDPLKSGKYITKNTTDILLDGQKNPNIATLFEQYPETFCLSKSALLTDTLNGGLRIDLTPYLRDDSAIGSATIQTSDGVSKNDFDPIINHQRMRVFSPKFGALRDYAQLANYVGSDREAAPRAPLGGGGRDQNFSDPTRVVRQGLHPVIAEYNTYVAVAIDPSTASGIRLQLYPRVTLWNPYNVRIETSQYLLQENAKSGYFIGVRKRSNGNNVNHAYNTNFRYWVNANGGGGGYQNNDGTLAHGWYGFYRLSSVTMEPGQAITFMPPNDTIRPLEGRNGNIANNVLVPDTDPLGTLGCFDIDCFGISQANEKFSTTSFLSEYRVYRVTSHGVKSGLQAILRLIPGSAPTNFGQLLQNVTSDNPTYPIVHVLDISNRIPGKEDYFARYSGSGPYVPFNTITPSATNVPYTRSKIGARLKAFREIGANVSNHNNAMWNYPLFESSNMHAPFYRRTPWDVPTMTTTHSGHGQSETIAFGPVTSDEIEQRGYVDQFMIPRRNDVNENSPFQNANAHPGELRFPLFEVPASADQIFNFAQFRSCTLTHEFSAPTFILGESLVNPASPRDQSAYNSSTYNSFWQKGLNMSTVQKDTSWWQNEYNPSTNYAAFDYRYETNHALWDKFFFSTLPDGADLTTNNTFPNRHINITNTKGETDADKIAASLELNNHHSVNSTNLLAWKALLMANRGVTIPHRNGNDVAPEQTPVIDSSETELGVVNPSASTDAETWAGHRALSDTEIDTLAKELIAEIKRRAPFISISDFVNRRLYQGPSPQSSPSLTIQSEEDLFSYGGPLEIAIRKAKLNSAFDDYPITQASSYESPEGSTPEHITANMPEENYTGAPAHISQGKILQSIGSNLTARSDSFKIRAYGSVTDVAGKVIAEAYCEAVVQRSIDFVDPSESPNTSIASLNSETNKRLGRKFVVKSFRWLPKSEIK